MRFISISLLAVVFSVVMLSTPTTAEPSEVGRYQVVALSPEEQTIGVKAIILDTEEGHFWFWYTAATQDPDTRARVSGQFIRYEGKVRPTKKAGGYYQIKPYKAP